MEKIHETTKGFYPHRIDDIARSQASEAVSLMSGAKTPMAEYYSDKGVWPAVSSVAGTVAGKYVNTITSSSSGASSDTGAVTLTATMKGAGDVNANIISSTVILTSTSGSTWTCSSGGGSAIDGKYLPAACR